MKVLLVYPKFPDTLKSYNNILRIINKKSYNPPLGLLTVASMLPVDWSKKLVDMNADELNETDLEWSDFVFISAMLVQRKSTLEIIKLAKHKGKFIVAGGPLFTSNYKEFENVDSIFLNEAELTFPIFLKDIENGKLKPIYSSEKRPDLINTPVPDWSLIDVNNYLSLPIEITRGCPFKCDFCYIVTYNGRVPRLKTPEQIITELDAIYNTGFRGSVFIVDDNFIGNKLKVKQILREMVKWMEEKKYPFYFDIQAPINIADDNELLDLMRKSNFTSIGLGIETPDEKSLACSGKVQNMNINLKEKIILLQKKGFLANSGFIVGFDTDNNETFDKIIDFINDCNIVITMIGLLVAVPSTTLYKRLEEEGRILGVPTGDSTDYSLNFIPKMKKEDLYAGYKKILSSVLKQKNYYKRIVSFLKVYNSFTIKRNELSFGVKLRLFLFVLWNLGIWDKGMFYFWKMILWTIFNKPYLLPEALRLSLHGIQYRKVMLLSKNDLQEL